MTQKTLATIGLTVMVTAIFVSWSTNHWVQTRVFDPVDTPVSLEPGQIHSGEFEINLRESYGIFVHLDDSLDDYYEDGRCSYRNLGKYHWKVFRITRGPLTTASGEINSRECLGSTRLNGKCLPERLASMPGILGCVFRLLPMNT